MPLKQVAIAIDQLGNALLGGWADESLSARAWRLSEQRGSAGWLLVVGVIDALFFWERDHCLNSYIREQQRAQLPREYRK